MNYKASSAKICCIIYALCGSSNLAHASEGGIKLKAVLDVAAIGYNNPGKDNISKLSSYNRQGSFFSAGNIFLNYSIKHEEIKYGAKIGLRHTTNNDRTAPFSLYTESAYGKIELGSDKSAAGKMMITGYTNSVSFGSMWDMFVGLGNKPGRSAVVSYVSSFSGFVDAKTRTSGMSEYGRKVTYFTPWFGGKANRVQLGVSYIPDTSNAGFSTVEKKHLHPVVASQNYLFAIKNALAYGVVYEYNISSDLKAKFAFTGEMGTPVVFDKITHDKKHDIKFKKVNVYNIGTELIYQQIALSANYMNYNKSITNINIDKLGTNTDLWSIGGRYSFADTPYAISAVLFHSNNKKNKVNAVTIGGSYKYAKGLKFHAQVTSLNTKGYYYDADKLMIDKGKGTLFVVGTKLAL